MADSFFSGFLRNGTDHTKFNHKQRLIQQREDAINYAKKLENEFNIRYKAFKLQLTELASRIKELEQQNKAKDQLLKGNSKVIMNKTTHIIKLEDEIKELKAKLLPKQQLKKTNSCPPCVHVTHTNKILIKTKKKVPNKPLPQIPPNANNNDNNNNNNNNCNEINPLPFIHRKTSTQTSSLSEAAVNLSFPGSNSPQFQHIQMSMSPITNIKPLQLSPICETKSRDDHDDDDAGCNKKKRMDLIKISDDNVNIVNEWGQSIAGSDVLDDHECTIANNNKNNNNNISDSSEAEPSFYDMDGIENGELLSVRKHSDISLMSDNTIMLNDVNHTPTIDNNTNNNNDNKNNNIKNNHFSQKSSGNLEGCDIIQAPVSIFSINHSFRIILNDEIHENILNYQTNSDKALTSQ